MLNCGFQNPKNSSLLFSHHIPPLSLCSGHIGLLLAPQYLSTQFIIWPLVIQVFIIYHLLREVTDHPIQCSHSIPLYHITLFKFSLLYLSPLVFFLFVYYLISFNLSPRRVETLYSPYPQHICRADSGTYRFPVHSR